MDFFNSIQYGRKPYTVGVIYPPLINLIYAIFGMGIPDSVKAQGTLAYRTSLQGIVALVLFYVMLYCCISLRGKMILASLIKKSFF